MNIEYGECHCGCGKETNVHNGIVRRFINGHTRRKKIRYLIDNKTGCWNWQLYKSFDYGVIHIKKKPMQAHRYYYEKYKGKIPKGLVIDHLCRNKGCVNPEHLEVVTIGENTRRGKSGKLTQEDVADLRSLYKTGEYKQKDLAVMFGIGRPHTCQIIHYQKRTTN